MAEHPLQPLGGSGKTYRLADNLTTDYQDFADLKTLWETTIVSDQMLMEMIAASDDTMDRHARTPWIMDAVSASNTAMDAVSASNTAMDAVSASNTAMDAVSASNTAMDAVSASSTARDAIWQSDLAFDAVAAVNMAIGKYAAGYAGLTPSNWADMDAVSASNTAMDAVSASSTARDAIWQSDLAFDAVAAVNMAIGKYAAGYAGLTPSNWADMDAVSASNTAMDAVSASLLAYSAAFESDYAVDSLWASTPGASTILKNSGANTLPYTPGSSGSGTFSVDDGTDAALPGNAAHQLFLDVSSGSDGLFEQTYSIDLSNSNTLEVTDMNPSTYGTPYYYGISIDGNNLYRIGTSTSSFTTRSFDISGYNATHDVSFFLEQNSGYSGQSMSVVWANLDLI